jgi:YggT family protein
MFNLLPFTNLFWILANLLQILVLLIMVEVILSWAMMFGARGVSPYHPWVRTLRRVTNPVLEPLRRLAPPYKMGGFDISPMLAILLIYVVQNFLFKAGL